MEIIIRRKIVDNNFYLVWFDVKYQNALGWIHTGPQFPPELSPDCLRVRIAMWTLWGRSIIWIRTTNKPFTGTPADKAGFSPLKMQFSDEHFQQPRPVDRKPTTETCADGGTACLGNYWSCRNEWGRCRVRALRSTGEGRTLCQKLRMVMENLKSFPEPQTPSMTASQQGFNWKMFEFEFIFRKF